MSRLRIVCFGCDGRQVIRGIDCDVCEARGWLPLPALVGQAILGLLLIVALIVGSVVWL